jgi:serine palmitoyltransferase
VDEWTPEPLGEALDEEQQAFLDNVPVIAGPQGPRPKLASTGKTVLNLASFNFTGLAGNEEIKRRAVETLRKYGLGSCGPSGFYGTLGTSGSPLFLQCCSLHRNIRCPHAV